MFFDLEELYVQAVVAEVPHTMVQLMDKGLNKIKKKGLCSHVPVSASRVAPVPHSRVVAPMFARSPP